MMLTRTLETASKNRFLTIYFFLDFLGSEPEPAEPEPAESGVVTEPLEPNRLDQEPTRTEPNRPFPGNGKPANLVNRLIRKCLPSTTQFSGVISKAGACISWTT